MKGGQNAPQNVPTPTPSNGTKTPRSMPADVHQALVDMWVEIVVAEVLCNQSDEQAFACGVVAEPEGDPPTVAR